MSQETFVVIAIAIGLAAFVWIETGLALKLVGVMVTMAAPLPVFLFPGDEIGQFLAIGGTLFAGLLMAGVGTLILDRRKELAARRLAPVEEPTRRAT